MATSYSQYLRLRIDSGLTANAKANLNILDNLGALIREDSTGRLLLQSRGDILLEPNSPDVDGSGSGGSVSFGSEDHPLDQVGIHTAALNVSAPLGMRDQATGGTRYLSLAYDSTLSGSVDLTANRVLSLDLNGANRSIILGANFSLSAALATAGSDPITLTGAAGGSTVTLPSSGTLATLSGTEILTNKSISGLTNTLTGIPLTTAVSGLLPISSGGTGQSSATAALIALLPSQTGHAGKVLSTDGTNVSWVSPNVGAVSSNTYPWSGVDTITVVHNLGTQNLDVTVRDENDDLIFVDIDIISGTAITLTSSEIPSGVWRITIQAITV